MIRIPFVVLSLALLGALAAAAPSLADPWAFDESSYTQTHYGGYYRIGTEPQVATRVFDNGNRQWETIFGDGYYRENRLVYTIQSIHPDLGDDAPFSVGRDWQVEGYPSGDNRPWDGR